MSPVTKGLLARSRKGGMLLPPSINQTKVYKILVNYGTFLLANFGVWGSDNWPIGFFLICVVCVIALDPGLACSGCGSRWKVKKFKAVG